MAAICAYSISTSLVDNQRAHSGPILPLSVHEQALNLRIGEQVLALVTPQVGNGPFHIVLPDLPRLTDPEPDQPVGRLVWPGLWLDSTYVDLSSAKGWNPRPAIPAGALPLSSFRHFTPALHASRGSDQNGFAGAVTARLEQGVHALQRFLASGDWKLLGQAVNMLGGLGSGLTPAGDDLLVGFLARLWLEPTRAPQNRTPTQIGQAIGQQSRGRTTRLSAAWLEHAGRGEFGQRWHDLAGALASADREQCRLAVEQLLAVGATSGRDAWQGFVLPFGTP